MVRGKTQMKRIENASSRQVTFSKRRSGLLKKAFELSVLCDAEVALIIFSHSGRLYEFSSSSLMSNTIERYQKNAKSTLANLRITEEVYMQKLKDEATDSYKKLDQLEDAKRKLLGENIDSCSINELVHVEEQLGKSLSKIRARKNALMQEQIHQLKQQEAKLMKVNTDLKEKCEMLAMSSVPISQPLSPDMEVETGLFIGPPKTKIFQRENKRILSKKNA
ncbi:agamous-like MADS-box protein AGL19 isoform X1 [Primulina tabacum]|uniref:agamous-like MADS-box protein AGL19 isoform X1 n=1 Tax=Primulina tabacum TaxID=48773 RepID=UPI003F5A6FBA